MSEMPIWVVIGSTRAYTTLRYALQSSWMKIIAVITDYDEIQKILACLRKNKSPPYDKVVDKIQEAVV